MITLRNITIRRGGNVLLQNLNWTIYHKQHIGIVGANGCGKSTLFSLFLQDIQADTGDLDFPKQLQIAHVAQETPGYADIALEYVLDGDTELRKLEADLRQAEADDDGERIAHLHQRFSEIDAYSARARAAQLLAGLSFTPEEQHQSVNTFSGGWRVRLNLAKALMCRSDILLLDEPTNHLDLDAVIWLEEWLKRYPGTLLLISHDREFLDEIVDHVAHISHQELKLYSGNYSTFEKQRAANLLLQQAAYDKQQKYISHLQKFVDRFKAKASKAKQAQSRVKALAKLELVNAVQSESPFHFNFKSPAQCPNPLITVRDATIAYGDKIVLENLNLYIGPKDRIALLGPNGAGKSSFIKLLAGEVATTHGQVELASGLKIGYFAQHQVDHLNLTESPLYHLRELAPNKKDQDLRTYLGSFGFIGNEVLTPVKNFSGGEKSRLALALIVWQAPNLLLLDEPTNHLDLAMRQALSLALQEYEGAMVLVSHDRFLVKTTVDQLMLVANHKLEPFTGDLNEYQTWLLNYRRQTPNTEKESSSRKKQRQHTAQTNAARNPLLKKQKQLENELLKLEKEVAAIELRLADTELYAPHNKAQLQTALKQQDQIKARITAIEAEWLEISASLE